MPGLEASLDPLRLKITLMFCLNCEEFKFEVYISGSGIYKREDLTLVFSLFEAAVHHFGDLFFKIVEFQKFLF